MGLRVRKTIKIAPGIRTTISKSGVSYSAGGKYGRVTKTARGRVVGTAKLPGSGVSYVQNLGGQSTKGQRGSRAGQVRAAGANGYPVTQRHVAKPPPTLKWWVLAAVVGFVVSLAFLPLMLLEIPVLGVLIVMLVKHLRASVRADAQNRSQVR